MTHPEKRTVTLLLEEWRQGSDRALDRLLPLVYDELRGLARGHMRGERADHTLQPTALVHEAFARLVEADVRWEDRAHFLGVSARVMRQVLVDHARSRAAAKRGAGALQVTLDEQQASGPRDWDVMALDDALSRLASLDPRQGRAVEMHYFGGLLHREIAEALGISEATVDRDLRHARAWLRRELGR